jgi:16S rRNA (cytosine1402-N4)-methyltransferase
MLFTPPILTIEAVRNTAAPVALARLSGLGLFSDGMAGSGQHAAPSIQTDVRTAPGWLSARHPVIFMAGRTKSLGTELLALFETMVRTAPGWLSVWPSQIFFSDALAGSGQHARLSIQTDVRTAPGWLSARRLVIFMAGRTKSLGTELFALFERVVRVAPGWLSARPPQIFFSDELAGSGQQAASSILTDVRTAPGWLSVRRPVIFLAGRMEFFGNVLHSLFGTMVRATSGVLSARPSQFFLSGQNGALGTAHRFAGQTDACTAPGWLSAQAPVDFSEPMAAGDYHLPVFPAETSEWMAAGAGKFIIDGTLGGGGHSEIFLKAGARVLGIDRDPEALAHARIRLQAYGERFSTWEGNFSRIAEIPEIQMGERADGLLMDLGVSSRQLDSAVRGFSFMREGPLDMRMGPSSPRTAADIVNRWPEADIVRILFEFGEESKARRIAGAIVRQRAIKSFETTLELANCIEKAIGRHGRTHPATKTFQAIRMAVNEELESLAAALAAAPAALKPGGRLLIITFHSLEDRIVKRFLKHRSTEFLDDPGWPEPRPNPDYQFRLLARKAITPGAEETSLNPRARSAKLRVAQLLDPKP